MNIYLSITAHLLVMFGIMMLPAALPAYFRPSLFFSRNKTSQLLRLLLSAYLAITLFLTLWIFMPLFIGIGFWSEAVQPYEALLKFIHFNKEGIRQDWNLRIDMMADR